MNTHTDHQTEPLLSPEAIRRWTDGMPRPVAVTGGTGFVGSHLVDSLCAAGIRPRVLVRTPDAPRWIGGKSVEWFPGDLSDREAVRRLVDGVGTVFHLAGVLRAVRSMDFDSANRGGTARLISALRDVAPDARLVFVSSLAAVGPSAVPIGVSPDAKPHPISDYGRSKLAAEKEVRGLTGVGWWSIVRPPAVYGPRDTDVFQFFRMARAGFMLVPVGERWISVAHVADVVRGTLAAAVGELGRTYHLGEPEPHRMEDLLRQLARVGRVKARLLKVPSPAVKAVGIGGSVLWRVGLRGIAMTPDKAREILSRHWTSQTRDSLRTLGLGDWTAFADGAGETWAWYRQQKWLS